MHFISCRNSDYFSLELWMFDNQKLFSTDCQGFWNWLRLFTDHGIGRFQFFSWAVCFQQFYATCSALIDLRGRKVLFLLLWHAGCPKTVKTIFCNMYAGKIYFLPVCLIIQAKDKFYCPKLSFQKPRRNSKLGQQSADFAKLQNNLSLNNLMISLITSVVMKKKFNLMMKLMFRLRQRWDG